MMEEGQKLVVRLVGRNGRRRFDPASNGRLLRPALNLVISIETCARTRGQREPRLENG